MAKAGGRKYNRDKNGKFASTGGARLGGKSSGPKLGSNRPHGSAPKGTIIKGTNGRPGVGPASKATRAGATALANKSAPKRPGLSPQKQALAKELGKQRGQMKAQNAASPNQRIRNALTRDSVAFAKQNIGAKSAPAPKSGGGGSKAASTRKANSSRAADLKAKGTTAIGGRVKAKGFAGGKAAQERAGGLRRDRGGPGPLKRKAGTIGAGTRSQLNANAAQVGKARSKAASKGVQKMSKAPVSEAKARYKELSSRARKSSPDRPAAQNRAAAGARRALSNMVANRGVTKPAKRSRKK